jgi:hypothetical protein
MPDRGSPGMAWNFEEKIFRLGIYVNYFGRIYFRNCGPAGWGVLDRHPAPTHRITRNCQPVLGLTDHIRAITRKACYQVRPPTDPPFMPG